jgi:ribA/ribD-fused uncharacterized protein
LSKSQSKMHNSRMKKLLILLMLFQTINVFGEVIEDIPHYKIYPKTPAVDYQAETLDFYSVKNPYGEFSNFGLFPIMIENLIWPSSEHYYQAKKFLDQDWQEKVRHAPSPYDAAKIGRAEDSPVREDWEDVKAGFMLTALRAKYSQYDVLKELLLSTNNTHIYEHTTNDCDWADCGDRSGKNRLGEQLMQVRAELRLNSTINE